MHRQPASSPTVSGALPAELRLYDRLFTTATPADGWDDLNPDSLQTLTECRVEPSLASAAAGDRVQFERQGYFSVDPDSSAGNLIFNRTVPLRDTWARLQQREQPAPGAAG